MAQPRTIAVLILLSLCMGILCSGCTGPLVGKGPALKIYESMSRSPSDTSTGSGVRDISIIPITPDPTPAKTSLFPDSGNTGTYTPLTVAPKAGESSVVRDFTFMYRGISYSVSIPVNMSFYNAAVISPNKALMPKDTNDPALCREMLQDPAMNNFFNDVAEKVGKLRYAGGNILNDDEYLELLVSFVQQMPSEETAQPPCYPVEIVYASKGNSIEKSILLAGILAREGYDAALLVSPGRNISAAGIRVHSGINAPALRLFSSDRGMYAYVDTTTTRLIGIYPEGYETAPNPVVIPVGSGTTMYSKIGYIASIMYDLKTLQKNIGLLQKKAAVSGHFLSESDSEAFSSYVSTYSFVMSTNDRVAAIEAISESELPHHSACMSCR
jgi:hypothetical protein